MNRLLNNKHYPRTDLGNAEMFADRYKDRVLYDHSQKQWYLWNNEIWKPDTDGEIYRKAKSTIRSRLAHAEEISDEDIRKEEISWCYRSESGNKLDMMLKRASSEKELATSGEMWNKYPHLLGCPNGVIDLETGKLIKSDPKLFISMQTRIPYTQNPSKPERWLKFIKETWPSDEALQDYIWRVLGYSLTAFTMEQCYFALYGEGSNGKGILARILKEALGDYYHTIKFAALELKARGGISNDIIECSGKRMVFASETNDASRLNEGLVKSATGEDDITARQLYERNKTFLPHLKLFMAFNHKPVIKDITPGFWRRIRLISFLVRYSENYGRDGLPLPDLQLIGKLRQELPGILNWMVQGCIEWQKRGLEPPQSVLLDTQQYKNESHPLFDFINSYFVLGEEYIAEKSTIYDRYLTECNTFREKPLRQFEFNSLMESLGCKDHRVGKHRIRVWKGIKWNEDWESNNEIRGYKVDVH